MTNNSYPKSSNSNSASDFLKQKNNNDNIIYGSNDDEINCDNSGATAYGQDGDDIINGGRGDDNLYGGLGTDLIYGNDGNDWIYGDLVASPDGDDDFIYGGRGNDIIDGGGGNDEIYGEEDNDVISGNRGEDFIDGGSGNDQINGGEDNDFLRGAKGADILSGDHGRDIFEYPSLTESTRSEPDLILDFISGEDKIELSGFGFNNLAYGSQGHENHQLQYYYDDFGDTIIADPNSNLMIKLAGYIELNIGDFILH